jgi:Putative  PD-(D/E)XK family member, (DUF4420)
MKMQPIDALWKQARQKLSSIQLKEGEFHLVRIEESSLIPSYCGMDESGRLFLAFRTTRRPQIPELKTSAFDSHVSQRPDKTWLYNLRLVDQMLIGVFETLCIDLANEVSSTKTEEAAIRLLKTRVRAWEKLFASSHDGLLTRSQVIGLIGELTLLSDLIESRSMSIATALKAWQGPFGSDQDFILANEAIEAKTIREDINEISISSLEQLNTDRFSKIQLVINRYRDVAHDEKNAISLNELATKLGSAFSFDPMLLRDFNSSLLEAGYFYHESYDQISIAIVQKDAFDVIADFPRLMPSSVASGIIGAKYQISTQHFLSFKQPEYPYGNN